VDLKFQIDADWKSVSAAFKELANESEATRAKIEKFSESFKTEQIDKFVDKQKLTEIAMRGTKGEIAAMTTASNNYEKEITRLIKSGLDPESEAVKKLRDEHDKLSAKIKETNEVHKAQEQVLKNAERAALGLFAAIGAGVAAMGVAAQKTAEMGDQYAKASRVIGMTAETLQELNYAAKMSGVNNLEASLQKLNKSVADVKGGTGALTAYLKANDRQLLGQLKNVGSNEEAFNLLMDAINKAPDEFSRAELAQSAFGKSGQELILLANEGADGIASLREEARKYGVISNEAAKNSEAYLDAQERLKTALTGVSNELTAGLMPGITNTVNKIADFIAEVDNWENILTGVGIALAGTTAALTTFIAVSKGSQVINQMAVAIKGLQAAILGPAGAAAVAIGALAAGIAGLIAYQNQQANQGKEIAGRLTEQKEKANDLVSAYEKLNPQKAIDEETTRKLIQLYPELSGKIEANSTSVETLRDRLQELNEEKPLAEAAPFIEKARRQYDDYLKAVETFNQKEAALNADRTIENLNSFEAWKVVVDSSLKEVEKSKNKINDILSVIGKEVDVENNFEVIESVRVQLEKLAADAEEAERKASRSLSQRLNDSLMTEAQMLNDRINQIKSFLTQRANLERTEGEARIKSFQDELARIKANENITGEERIAAERAVSEAIIEVREQLTKELQEQDEEKNKNEEDSLDTHVQTITEKLQEIALSEQQVQNEQIEQFKSFLQQRGDLEFQNGESRLEWLLEQHAQILELETIQNEERSAQSKAITDMIIAEDERLKKAQRKILEEKMNTVSNFFKGIESLASIASENSIAILIVEKAAAAAQAAINSYLAFTEVLSDPSYIGRPWQRAIDAGVILAAGLAQQASIISTAIPSAETGGRFIVPNSVGSDSQYMRVNQGEEVEVTPRGMTGFNETQNITVQIEKETIFSIINEGIRSGDILIAATNY
jgi:hypothetical protein